MIKRLESIGLFIVNEIQNLLFVFFKHHTTCLFHSWYYPTIFFLVSSQDDFSEEHSVAWHCSILTEGK